MSRASNQIEKSQKPHNDALKELIPESVGSGSHRKGVQHRTLALWISFAVAGLALNSQQYYPLSTKARAATLSLLFPGAGYIASANVIGTVLLIVTYLLLPVTLLAWFGAGGILFPALLWILSVPGSYYTTGDAIFEKSNYVALGLLAAFMGYLNHFSRRARTNASTKRDARNAFIESELENMDALSLPAPGDADRELDLEALRAVQYLIDQARREIDDWTDFSVIDQFQTSALRYQLYEIIYVLSTYQGIYTPNFHGYLSTAIRKTIDKSLTPTVLGFWKWETLWGKFKTDFDPVKEDNIMVSGWLFQGLMLYMANTGDMRYTKPGSLRFQVSETAQYDYDVHSIGKALVRQWTENPYCLFPCEPNWIYTPCNLYGFTGQVLYDRVFNQNHSKKLLPIFEESLNANFTEEDGSIIPIRSELTGFTLPGLCGALSDLVNALLCRGHLDHIARRMWAIFKHECVRFNEGGEVELAGLVGADKIDPGNYKPNPFAIYTHLAYVAGEYGDEKTRKAAIQVIHKNIGTRITETGAVALKKDAASFAVNTGLVRGHLLRHEDWKNLVQKGPSKVALAGPILTEAPYPGVLVAKARSHDSKDLELVLYPSAKSGSFTFGVSKMTPNEKYTIAEGKTIQADAQGEAKFTHLVDGKTTVHLVLIK
ncbi:hypothetical protein BJ170DRAFT_630661 [Xylariales sp. AK1849]|nr:hypothetical protein BJ170DRAFT_630661 [Xylariales sp. AK1849]